MMRNVGPQGERGKVGDHGQDGRRGIQGEVGPAILSRAQTLVLFVFVVACFVLLAYRTEGNASSVKSNAQQACEQTNANSSVINNFLNLLIENVKTTKLYDEDEIARRVAGYEKLKVDLRDCV